MALPRAKDSRLGRRSGRRIGALVALALASSAPGVAAIGLLDTFHLAVDSDPEYLAAAAGNRAAQEIRPQARAALLPSIAANASVTGTDSDVRRSASGIRARPSFRSDSFALTVTQPLYRRDLLIGLEQAGTRIERADVEYAAARQDLMLRTAERYFAVLEALDTVTFARATVEAFGQQLKQSQQRFEVGLIAVTDVEEAQAGFDRARADLITAENQVDTALESLREVTGAYHDSLAPLGDSLPMVVPEPGDIDAWTQTALGQNLRVIAARLSSETARDDIRRAEAGHQPAVDLVGTHQRSSVGGGISGASRTWNSSIGVQLSLPIYQGGVVLSQTRESRHLHTQALELFERERRRAQRQTRNAFLGVKSGISRVEALNQAVRSAQSAKEAIEAGFQVGTRTSVDVLDADREVFRQKRDLAAARYAYILDILRLKQAAGTLSEDDVAQVSNWLN